MSDNIATRYYGAGKVPILTFGYYEKVLGAIYNRPFEIENDSMAQLLEEVMGLVDVGEYLGCMHVLYRTIDSMLVEHGQLLYRSVASNPVPWGELAIRIHSTTIAREAIIHLTGQWKKLDVVLKQQINPKLLQLVEKKYVDLDKLKEKIEKNLANWYPSNLQREITAADDRKVRHSYASEVINWLSLQVFRQWFSNAVVNGVNRCAADGGWSFFLALSKADQSYLDAKDMKKWHEKFPMTGRSSHNIVKHLDDIKIEVKQYVMPLFLNFSHLNITDWPVNYFTCTVVEREDIRNLFNSEQNFEWGQPANDYIDDYGYKLLVPTKSGLSLDSSPLASKKLRQV
jgi:hypothetical protein